ncbi:phasin [Caballeronia terrestris]|jgi:phasin family protein|uniref:Phasin n=2 Tax=Caballeronia terrestris TaxID=1226301 RepID=A0A158IJ83_9BURK|nr:phasin [Caballeronia terrestris]
MSTPFNPLTDFTKMLEQFKFPGVDSASITESTRKDLQALTEANRLAYEGMQALIRKQTELLNENARAIQTAAQQIQGATPTEVMASQSEFVQKSLQKAFDNMRQLAEIAQQSQTAAIAAMTRRAEENMQALKTITPSK